MLTSLTIKDLTKNCNLTTCKDCRFCMEAHRKNPNVTDTMLLCSMVTRAAVYIPVHPDSCCACGETYEQAMKDDGDHSNWTKNYDKLLRCDKCEMFYKGICCKAPQGVTDRNFEVEPDFFCGDFIHYCEEEED